MKDFKPNITSFITSLQFHMFDATKIFLNLIRQFLPTDLLFFYMAQLKCPRLLSFDVSTHQFGIFGIFHVCVHEINQVTVPRKYYPRCVNALLVPAP